MTEKRVISEPFIWSKESELESRLKEAEEVIKFYAEVGHWGVGDIRDNGFVDPCDMVAINGYETGGKRAREYFKKYGQKKE